MIGARPLSTSDVELLTMCFLKPREHMFFKFCLTTGVRPQEALSLRVRDVLGLDRALLLKRNTKGKVKSRSLYLPPPLQAHIRDYVLMQGLRSEQALFPSRESGDEAASYETMLRCFKVAVARAGLKGKVTLHSTRKTFASHIYNHFGKDIFRTAKLLGHHDVNNTLRYLSFETREADKAIEAMPWAALS